jgi:hypothetical protein
LSENPEALVLLGSPKFDSEDTITINLKELGVEFAIAFNWMRVESNGNETIMNLQVS